MVVQPVTASPRSSSAVPFRARGPDYTVHSVLHYRLNERIRVPGRAFVYLIFYSFIGSMRCLRL